MIYRYRCQSCGAELEASRSIKNRHRGPKCRRCGGKTRKAYTRFGIAGSHMGQHLYDFEQKDWALATGFRAETMKDVETWAHSNGKEIVGRDWKPDPEKRYDWIDEREAEKALDKYYSEHHTEDNPDGTPKDIEVKA